jgi:hypothetical protein
MPIRPKPTGRAASRRNALTFGLTAKQIIAPGESEQDVTEYLLKMCAELAPLAPKKKRRLPCKSL